MAASQPNATPPHRGRRWPRVLAASAAALLLLAAGVSWYVYRQLDGNIHTDLSIEDELARHHRPPPGAAENILLIGTDSRSGTEDRYGHDSGSARSDTVILLHIARHAHSAVAVSIPRDLMVGLPACRRPDGSTTAPQLAQFNWSFSFGGTACTILTVEQLTGARVDHHLVVDFNGFKTMVDAVDGVQVCVPSAVHDTDAGLDLAAGRQLLHGEQALAYVRARHAFGDGSDTERMDRQQAFLASLVKKVKSERVMLNPTKLVPVLEAATKSLSADPGLNSLTKLYDLVGTVQDIPARRVTFLTVPREPYPGDPNRDQLLQPQASQLFAALRGDRPVPVAPAGSDSPATGRSGGATTGTTAGSASTAGSTPRAEAPDGTAASAPPLGSARSLPTVPLASGTSLSPAPGGTPVFQGTTADHDVCRHRS